MGEHEGSGIRFGFNGSLRVAPRGSQLTADAGALMLREVDEAFGLTSSLAESLGERPDRSRYSTRELVRLRLYLLAQGYGVQSDADVLRGDPALRLATSDQRGLSPLRRSLPAQPTLSRFTRSLSTTEGRAALDRCVIASTVSALRLERPRILPRVLDIDSLPLDAHGVQGGSAYNGHYRRRCFHPQVVMDGSGHLLAARLRPGNESTSLGAWDLLERVINGLLENGVSVKKVRGDAGFPSEALLSHLEGRGVGYVFHLSQNPVLNRLAEPYVVRPVGRRPKEPREWTYVLRYRAKKWSRERRVVLVVQEDPKSLYLHHFFLVTSDESTTGRQVLAFYRRRGTMEGRLGEWVNHVRAALSSSHRDGRRVDESDDQPFRTNAATLLLSALAYNLLHTLRRMAVRARIAAIGTALGLGRARRLLLAVAGRMIVSARRATMVVPPGTEAMWSKVLAQLRRSRPEPAFH